MREIQHCNVCVVGGAGFLGSYLVDHLIDDRGCTVTVIDNLVAGRREFIHRKAKFEHHDITGSEGILTGIFNAHQIEYVFNYAAHPYVPDSFARPLHVFNVNAFGALKVINSAQTARVQGILQVSSAEIYGEAVGKDRKLSELDDATPHSSYGASKAAIDALCQIRWREAATPVIALRQFNCIGERETHPYVVPEIISQLAKQGTYYTRDGNTWASNGGRTAVVRLGNNSFRDFLYAGDAVRMAVELLEKGKFGEVYNLGSETGIRVHELAEKIALIMGFDGCVVQVDYARLRPWEIWHLQSDNKKIYEVIESRPTVSLGLALSRTVDYFHWNERKWVWES